MKFHESKRFSDDGKQKVALVDIDETICFYSGERRYDLSEPHQEILQKLISCTTVDGKLFTGRHEDQFQGVTIEIIHCLS